MEEFLKVPTNAYGLKSYDFYGLWIFLSLENDHLNRPNDPYYAHINVSLKWKYTYTKHPQNITSDPNLSSRHRDIEK